MLYEKTTANERLIIEDGMEDIMNRIDRANNLLIETWDEFFGSGDGMDRLKYNADILGDRIYIATDIIFSELNNFHLLIGAPDNMFRGLASYRRRIENYRLANEVEEKRSKLHNLARNLPEAKQKEVYTAIKGIMDLDDTEAISKLDALTKDLLEHIAEYVAKHH